MTLHDQNQESGRDWRIPRYPPATRAPADGHSLQALVDKHGWERLGQLIAIRCFTHDPSIESSLKFLRKTPWAREKVEALYIKDIAR